MRLVVVDDAAPARAIVARIARDLGYEFAGEAATLDDGLALVAATVPDTIVVDGRLPPDGGSAAVARLRAAAPHAAVYVVAALRETDLVRAALAAGATGALLRPLSTARVAAAFAAGAGAPDPA